MSQLEKWMDEYLSKKENEAWATFKQKTNFDKAALPEDMKSFIKDAFIIGYEMGSHEGWEEMKSVAKVDPVGFYNWLNY